VWAKLHQGEEADFNKEPDFKPGDPGDSEWDERREVRPEFLFTIAFNDPWRGAINSRGVRIVGAWLRKPLLFLHKALDHELALEFCRFDAPVDLGGMRTIHTLSIANSVFNDVVAMEQMKTVKSVHLRNASFGAEVRLCGAQIGGTLDMTGARFRGALRMDHIRVTGSLLLSGALVEGAMNLASGRVGKSLNLAGARMGDVYLTGPRESKFPKLVAEFQQR
jgi:hypothetical protein